MGRYFSRSFKALPTDVRSRIEHIAHVLVDDNKTFSEDDRLDAAVTLAQARSRQCALAFEPRTPSIQVDNATILPLREKEK